MYRVDANGRVDRMTTEDVEINGVLIPAGTFVMCNTAAANHDPDVYIEPDRFDKLLDEVERR